MITVTEAKEIINKNVTTLAPVKSMLSQAANKVLAEDVYALVDIPAFPQSSMDGYAFCYDGWRQHKKLRIVGEVAAGDNKELALEPENAVRIFTGGAVPTGADTVIMQEEVKTVNGELIIEDQNL